MKTEIIIFTDGASKGNPGPGGFAAVIVAGNSDIKDADKKVYEIGGGDPHTTNNKMEMMAVIAALEFVDKNLGNDVPGNENNSRKIIIYLDSSYVLKGITKWVAGWQESGWITKSKKEVLNRGLWERMARAVSGKNIEWKLLSGHVGIAGNERADEIATDFAGTIEAESKSKLGPKSGPKLFSGPLKDYKIDILNISHDADKKIAKTAKSSRSRSQAKAYSYLSMVKGEIKIHKTWAECEARVKGVSGAKFKKSTSPEEERQIISEWSK